MKKRAVLLAAILLAILLALAGPALAEAAANPTERYCGCWQDPEYGRAMLKIMRSSGTDLPEDELWYTVRMTWGDSAWSQAVWDMSARYDEASDALVYRDGSMSYMTYDDDGKIVGVQRQWGDAEGRYTFSDGKLLWEDSRDARAAEFAFERVPQLTPTADEFRDRYFVPVADSESGTAGSALKLAGLCADLLDFADEYRLWDADIPALRQNMLEAWEALDEDARQRFDAALPDVMALMDQAFSSYGEVAGQFEDAGAKRMVTLAADREARESWDTLIAHTYTMGNSDE